MNKTTSKYNAKPEIKIEGFDQEISFGYPAIAKELTTKLDDGDNIIVVETYPGVYKDEIIKGLSSINFSKVFDTDKAMKSGKELTDYLADELTEDRVFGHMTQKTIGNLIDIAAKIKLEEEIKSSKGNILLIGMGASLFAKADVVIYADMARWEIQRRFRNKTLANYNCDNYGEDTLKMYKRGFFIEWRIADRLKRNIWQDIDYYLDTNSVNNPKMLTKNAFFTALSHATTRPFSTVPYFDPGVWGGQWLKEVCNLDRNSLNYAWSFNGVPEENSLLFNFNGHLVEMPAINVVFYRPIELLGELTYARYGAEFPIRFDLLDTMDGGNLSLQVHPITDYIQQKFGMHYTQDESYYMIDAKRGAKVYLGLTNDCDVDEMFEELSRANKDGTNFDDSKYINSFEAKKHDHFSIPSGTIHCSGKDSVVLEISNTPYIFTFKMWDWGRLGLDGRPRPVHLEHAKNVVVDSRRTDWVKKNLVNPFVTIKEEAGVKEEKTGLAYNQSIETRRTWFNCSTTIKTQGTVNMFSLVEGNEVVISCPNNSFEPINTHYMECIIVPAQCKEFTITPVGEGEFAIIRAYIRGSERDNC